MPNTGAGRKTRNTNLTILAARCIVYRSRLLLPIFPEDVGISSFLYLSDYLVHCTLQHSNQLIDLSVSVLECVLESLASRKSPLLFREAFFQSPYEFIHCHKSRKTVEMRSKISFVRIIKASKDISNAYVY